MKQTGAIEIYTVLHLGCLILYAYYIQALYEELSYLLIILYPYTIFLLIITISLLFALYEELGILAALYYMLTIY